MSHADTLRKHAAGYTGLRGYEDLAAAAIAGADALDTRAHAVIAQAETIKTLSRLLAGAEAAATERAEQIERLRREIEALRKAWAAPDDPADDYGRGMEAAYQIAADDLTRILEGDTDE